MGGRIIIILIGVLFSDSGKELGDSLSQKSCLSTTVEVTIVSFSIAHCNPILCQLMGGREA